MVAKTGKTITVKKQSTALVSWESELAQEAEIAASEEQKGGSYISTRSGQLSYGGNAIPGNEIDVIILDYVFENAYYPEKFDADNPASPVCFAFAKKEVELAPHEDSEEPQHTQCEGCPRNEFGTADTGRGKACKNGRKLALVTSDSLDSLEDAQVALMNIPATSVKGWATYTQQIALAAKRPSYAVVTRISLTPDKNTQFKIGFKMVELIDKEYIEALRNKRAQVDALLRTPYKKNTEAVAVKPNRKLSGKKPLSARRTKF